MNTATERPAIEQLLFAYRDALNASDAAKVVALYTHDGIVMPPDAPTASGQEQLKTTYGFLFTAVQLTLEFSVDEVTISGDHAYARTHSQGHSLIHANGATAPITNKELFVVRKENGQWKIARYMFNQTK